MHIDEEFTPASKDEPDRLEVVEQEISECCAELASRNPKLRTRAVKRLGELHARTDLLLQSIEDPNDYVRTEAARALGYAAESLTPEVYQALVGCLYETNDFVCCSAIQSLGRLKAVEAIPEVEPFLEDENNHLISSALIALGKMGAHELIPRIDSFTDHPNLYIRSAAFEALADLNHQPVCPKIIATLEGLLPDLNQHPHYIIAINCILALAHLACDEAIPILTQIAQTRVGLRSKAIEALIGLNSDAVVPVLLPLLQDPGEKIRTRILQLITLKRFTPALAVVRPLLKDGNYAVRRYAIQAVVELEDASSLQQLKWMAYHDPSPFLRVNALHGYLKVAGQTSADDLMELATDSNVLIRKSLVEEIAALDALTPAVEHALQILAHDELSEVSLPARAILESRNVLLADLPPVRPSARPQVPGVVSAEAASLLARLAAWQEGLSELLADQGIERIEQTDQALALLIRQLEEELRRGDSAL